MANIQIYANLEDAAIHFDGSTVVPQSLGSVVAVQHPTEADRIIIKSTKLKPNGAERVFFKRLKALRVENQAGVALIIHQGLQ